MDKRVRGMSVGQRVKVYDRRVPAGSVGKIVALYTDPQVQPWCVVNLEGKLGVWTMDLSLVREA